VSVHQDVGRFNQTLQAGATPAFDVKGQKRVQALAGVCVCDRKS
jgi:hypothetical protein